MAALQYFTSNLCLEQIRLALLESYERGSGVQIDNDLFLWFNLLLMVARLERGITPAMLKTVRIRFGHELEPAEKALCREIGRRAEKKGMQRAYEDTVRDLKDNLHDASRGGIINQDKFQEVVYGIEDEPWRDVVSLAGVFVERVQTDPSIAPDVAEKVLCAVAHKFANGKIIEEALAPGHN